MWWQSKGWRQVCTLPWTLRDISTAQWVPGTFGLLGWFGFVGGGRRPRWDLETAFVKMVTYRKAFKSRSGGSCCKAMQHSLSSVSTEFRGNISWPVKIYTLCSFEELPNVGHVVEEAIQLAGYILVSHLWNGMEWLQLLLNCTRKTVGGGAPMGHTLLLTAV